jgi:hypothetical protein
MTGDSASWMRRRGEGVPSRMREAAFQRPDVGTAAGRQRPASYARGRAPSRPVAGISGWSDKEVPSPLISSRSRPRGAILRSRRLKKALLARAQQDPSGSRHRSGCHLAAAAPRRHPAVRPWRHRGTSACPSVVVAAVGLVLSSPAIVSLSYQASAGASSRPRGRRWWAPVRAAHRERGPGIPAVSRGSCSVRG